MKIFLKAVAVFAAILLVSAALTPVLDDLLPYKFEKIFRRMVMVLTLLAVALFVKVRRETLVRFEMDWRKDSAALLGKGLLIGFGVLTAFTLTEFLIGNARWAPRDYGAFTWVRKIFGCFLTAAVIGPLEEFFFRGFVYTSFRDKLFRGKVLPGMVLASVFYSLIHFIDFRQASIAPDPGFVDGLKLIAAPLQSLARWQDQWPAAIGLFLFGMALNYGVVRSKSLYPSIGLHASCVLFVRMVGYFIGFLEHHKFLLSTKKVYDGALGWAFLLLIGFLFHKFLKQANTDRSSVRR